MLLMILSAIAVVSMVVLLFLPFPQEDQRPSHLVVIEVREGPPDNVELPEYQAYDRAFQEAMDEAVSRDGQFTYTREMVELAQAYRAALERDALLHQEQEGDHEC